MADDADPSSKAAGARGRAPRPDRMRLYSHDIRAAMSDVIGGLRLVDLHRLDPDTRAQLERVQAAGETLAELLDAALMAAAGDAPLDLDDRGVDLARYLTGLDMRWSGHAAEMARGFTLLRGPDLPERLAVPRLALDRILANMIGNALKHAPSGDVTLEVARGGDDSLCLAVTDLGAGFAPAARARLFQPGARAEAAGVPGSGLGLHIAKTIADGLGASLAVAPDRPGRGASVSLTIPRTVWLEAPGRPAADPAPDLSGLSILVAEDNATNQVIVRQLLTGMGSEPTIANDGIEALEMLERRPFDIALVDIEMPRMSGMEFMAAVRGRGDARAGMPLVALTAYVLRDNREAIYSAGADGIIAKPIRSAAAFGRAILRHAGRAERPGQPPADGAPDEAAAMNDTTFEELLEAAGADGTPELLDRLLEDLADVAETLGPAVAGADTREIRAQTHILVSLAGAVGAERLRHRAEALNLAAQRDRRSDLPSLWADCDGDLSDLVHRIARRRAGLGG